MDLEVKIVVVDDSKPFTNVVDKNADVTVLRTAASGRRYMRGNEGTPVKIDYLVMDGYLDARQTGVEFLQYSSAMELLDEVAVIILASADIGMNLNMKKVIEQQYTQVYEKLPDGLYTDFIESGVDAIVMRRNQTPHGDTACQQK